MLKYGRPRVRKGRPGSAACQSGTLSRCPTRGRKMDGNHDLSRRTQVINAKDVEFYREKGYLLVENVLDAATLTKIRKSIADLVAKASGVTAHNDIYDLEPTHTPENPRVRRIKTPHKVDPFFLEVVRQPGM